MTKEFKVEVKKDHLSSIVNSSPKEALAELIWNSFDADAKNVNVSFTEGELGAGQIIVSDDGTGFSYEDAENLFAPLGGSWKKEKVKTKNGRFLHGKHSKGRFKAFSLGRIVVWMVTCEKDGRLFDFTIEGRSNNLGTFVLSDASESKQASTGVTVEISELESEKFHATDSDKAHDQFAPLFAPYLSNYEMASLSVSDKRIDPDALIRHKKSFPLTPIDVEGKQQPVELELVEWRDPLKHEIWFCDGGGFPLESYKKKIRGIGNFGYTARLRSDYFRDFHNQNRLSLANLEPTIVSSCEEATKTIKGYFVTRHSEEAKDQIEEWKEKNIYPYQGEPETLVEQAEREIFDVLAIKVNQNLPKSRKTSKQSEQFQLHMLKHVLETDTEHLLKILNEIFELSSTSIEELAELLENTSLSSIIKVSQIIADRISFLKALEHLIYEHKADLKERNQLHRLVAENTWIFGESFTLSANNESLTTVLEKHAKSKRLDIVINDPVLRTDGSEGIVDLMLTREIPRNHKDELEHLVVELKRPSVKVGKKEIDQIEGYALAVARDERFRGLNTKWNFWIISNDYDEYAVDKLEERKRGSKDGILFQLAKDVDVTVWLKTWSQLLKENEYRLHFVRDKLNYNINNEQALRKLKKIYPKYIGGIKVKEDSVQESQSETEGDAKS